MYVHIPVICGVSLACAVIELTSSSNKLTMKIRRKNERERERGGGGEGGGGGREGVREGERETERQIGREREILRMTENDRVMCTSWLPQY